MIICSCFCSVSFLQLAHFEEPLTAGVCFFLWGHDDQTLGNSPISYALLILIQEVPYYWLCTMGLRQWVTTHATMKSATTSRGCGVIGKRSANSPKVF